MSADKGEWEEENRVVRLEQRRGKVESERRGETGTGKVEKGVVAVEG